MGIQDRDWYRQEQKRKRRQWRWPYRLRPDLPYWVTEWVRAALFFGALGLLYVAWSYFRASP
jgi:hypothetical protein